MRASPKVGDWARVFDNPARGLNTGAWRIFLDPAVMRQYMAGYYGSINHIDDQIGRILAHTPQNTIVLFTSDHGEMLGKHQWIRKRNAFEGSSHIPLIIRYPRGAGEIGGRAIEPVTELMDVMPTILDAVGVQVPESVVGRSLVPLMEGREVDWRTHIHGECSRIPTIGSGMQFITDGHRKYIYYPATGAEQFFDLDADPDEMNECIGDKKHGGHISEYRDRLTAELEARPEGFVRNGKLVPTGGFTPDFLPGLEQ